LPKDVDGHTDTRSDGIGYLKAHLVRIARGDQPCTEVRNLSGHPVVRTLGDLAEDRPLSNGRHRKTEPQRTANRFRKGRHIIRLLGRDRAIARHVGFHGGVAIIIDNHQIQGPCDIGNSLFTRQRGFDRCRAVDLGGCD